MSLFSHHLQAGVRDRFGGGKKESHLEEESEGVRRDKHRANIHRVTQGRKPGKREANMSTANKKTTRKRIKAQPRPDPHPVGFKGKAYQNADLILYIVRGPLGFFLMAQNANEAKPWDQIRSLHTHAEISEAKADASKTILAIEDPKRHVSIQDLHRSPLWANSKNALTALAQALKDDLPLVGPAFYEKTRQDIYEEDAKRHAPELNAQERADENDRREELGLETEERL